MRVPLRAVLTYDNRMEFHAVGFDKEIIRKGIPHQTGLIDCTEHLRLRFIPFSPVFSPRFLVRIDLVKVNMDGGARELGKWYVEQQEDNLPTDFGRSGLAVSHSSLSWRCGSRIADCEDEQFLPGSRLVSDLIKWGLGVGTLVAGNAFGYLNLV